MGDAGSTAMGTTGLRVLVVDHRRAFSEGLARRLAQESDVVVVGIAKSSEAAEDALDEVHPTVVTVAMDLEDGGGLVLVTRARRTHPAIRWVVVGGDGEPLDLADAMVAGASGYVTMSSPVAALAAALWGAAAGLSVTPEELLRRAIVELDTRGTRHLDLDCRDGAGGRGRRPRHTPSPACWNW